MTLAEIDAILAKLDEERSDALYELVMETDLGSGPEVIDPIVDRVANAHRAFNAALEIWEPLSEAVKAAAGNPSPALKIVH